MPDRTKSLPVPFIGECQKLLLIKQVLWGGLWCCCGDRLSVVVILKFQETIGGKDEQMEKRNVRVSAGAEALSVLGLVLAVVTVISPFWGRFSNEGNPNTGGNIHIIFFLYFKHIRNLLDNCERKKEREKRK